MPDAKVLPLTGTDRESKDTLVAIVDDEESVRRAFDRLVRAAGYGVATYASGADFLQSLSTTRPDCILLDVHMSGIGGFDVLKALGQQPTWIPVLVVTADCTPSTAERALALGAIACLRKPVESAVLLDALSAALQSGKAARAAK